MEHVIFQIAILAAIEEIYRSDNPMMKRMELQAFIETLAAKDQGTIDLTNQAQAEQVMQVASDIYGQGLTLADLDTIEQALRSQYKEAKVFTLLALKLACSKMYMQAHRGALHVSVVFAMYKEHNRIRTSNEHPHGEDFLVNKLKHLEWLFADSPQTSWELIIVDDGCPENSGGIAREIIAAHGYGQKARVLFLQEGIDQKAPPVRQLSSTKESQKGGSILYGMWDAVQQGGVKDHIVAFTDADLSTHLGQLGLLLNPILAGSGDVAIGSRREPTSVAVKKGTRNTRGKLFIYLWKRLIPNLAHIIDTQCGFKAFRASMVEKIIDDMIEARFAFDIELLLKAALVKPDTIAKVPIAWIDSEQASTTTDIQPYLPMLRATASMYRKYFPVEETAESFATFLESLSEADFQQLLDHIPPEIANREPHEFASYDGVKAADLTV